jgi:hypothetical protein
LQLGAVEKHRENEAARELAEADALAKRKEELLTERAGRAVKNEQEAAAIRARLRKNTQ